MINPVNKFLASMSASRLGDETPPMAYKSENMTDILVDSALLEFVSLNNLEPKGYLTVMPPSSYLCRPDPSGDNRVETKYDNISYFSDFKIFFRLMMAFLKLPKPDNVQLDICDWLQWGPRWSITMAWRGTGKSLITQGFAVYRLATNPTKAMVGVVTSSAKLCEDIARGVRSLIHNWELLKFLRPKPGQPNQALRFSVGPSMTGKDPSFWAGHDNGTGVTGSRSTDLIVDDFETKNNVGTKKSRDKLLAGFEEIMKLIVPSTADQKTTITVLGTPHTQDTVYKKLESIHKFGRRVWPILFPSDPSTYAGSLAPFITRMLAEHGVETLAGVPVVMSIHPDTKKIIPSRWTMEEIDRQAGSKSSFQLNFMLNPNLTDIDRHPLKLRNLMTLSVDANKAPLSVAWSGSNTYKSEYDPWAFDVDAVQKPAYVDEKFVDYDHKIISIDPAGTGKDKTDYSVIGRCAGNFYLIDRNNTPAGMAKDKFEHIMMQAVKYDVDAVVVESNYGYAYDMAVICAKSVGFKGAVIPLKATSRMSKENRILDIMTYVTENHRLIINEDLLVAEMRACDAVGVLTEGGTDTSIYSLFYQYTNMTAEKNCLAHDDAIDSLATGLLYFRDHLSIDTSTALHRKQQQMEKQVYVIGSVQHQIDRGIPVNVPRQKLPRASRYS